MVVVNAVGIYYAFLQAVIKNIGMASFRKR